MKIENIWNGCRYDFDPPTILFGEKLNALFVGLYFGQIECLGLVGTQGKKIAVMECGTVLIDEIERIDYNDRESAQQFLD